MNKNLIQLIISKTIMFAIILIFVNLFSTIFGASNTLLGVSTLTLALSLMGQNLLADPWRNLGMMLLVNLVIGIAAFVAPLNIWLGLIINFVILFAIGYFFSFTIRRSLTLLVGLHYLFLLNTPITLEEAPLRLLALIAGPLIIMAIQLVINHRKLEKTSPSQIDSFQTEMNNQLDNYITGSPFDFSELKVKFDNFKVVIHGTIPNARSLNDYQSAVLTITSNFEYLTELLPQQIKYLTPELAVSLKDQIANVLADPHSDWQKNWEQAITVTPLTQQLTAVLMSLAESVTIWKTANPQAKAERLPKEFDLEAILMRNLNLHNINTRYALRLALLISIGFFLIQVFEFEYGRWLLFTLLSLTQPYSESTVERSKKRIIGTLVGAAVGFVALTLVPNPDIRLLLIILFGYLSSYVTDYRNTMVFVTVTAVSAVALYSADPAASFLIRLMWVIAGAVIAVIASQFIFKTSYHDEARDLADLQTKIEQYEFYQLLTQPAVKINSGYFYSLAPTIASRIASSKLAESTPRYQLHNQRILYLHQIFVATRSHRDDFMQIKEITASNESFEKKYEQLQYLRAVAKTPQDYHLATIASQLYATDSNKSIIID